MTERQWFVAFTKSKHEKKIKAKLDEMGVENYLAVREEVHQWKDRKKKVEVMLIPCVIFIRGIKKDVLALHNECGIPISFMRNLTTKQIMVVPEKQMQDFMFVLDMTDDVEVADLNLKRGDFVRITKGVLSNVEGELLSVKGKKKVVIRIEGLVAIAVEIPAAYIEKLKKEPA